MKQETHKPGTPPDTEPTVTQSVLPVWFMVLVAMGALAGMLFLDRHGGGFNALVYFPNYSYRQVDALQPRSAEGELAFKGQKIYKQYCEVCHQASGLGLPGNFPPLAGSDWVLTEGPDRIIRLILDGIQGPITVNGQPFNNAMPPWKDLLKDEDVAAVTSYIRINKAWGNAASGVTPEHVKAIREEAAGRSLPWTPEELLQIPDKK